MGSTQKKFESKITGISESIVAITTASIRKLVCGYHIELINSFEVSQDGYCKRKSRRSFGWKNS